MKKKFLNYMLLGVFTFALSLSFAGCSDYDDDIDNLQEQINAQKDLTAKITGIESALTQLQNKDSELQGLISSTATSEAEKAAAKAKSEAIAAATTALNEAKAGLQAEIETVKTTMNGYAGRLEQAEKDVVSLIAKVEAIGAFDLDAMKTSIIALDAKVAQALLDIESNRATIALQIAALEKYGYEGTEEALEALKAAQDELNAIKADYVSKEDLDAALAGLANIDFEELEKMVDTINAGLNTMKKTVNSMVTSVRLVSASYNGEVMSRFSMDDNRGSGMSFNVTKAIVATDFGLAAGYENGFKFTVGAEEQKARSKVLIQVNPVNANITAEQLSLINSKGETKVNDFMKAVEVKKYNDLLVTRGLPAETGLYEVTFELQNADANAHKGVTYTANGDQVLFAVAVENTIDTEEDATDRHVLSTFHLQTYLNNVAPFYNLGFKVNEKNVQNLANRFLNYISPNVVGLADYKWNSTTPSNNTKPAEASKKEIDENDVRGYNDYFYAGVGETFKVSYTGFDKPYAYYVILDRAGLGYAEDDYVSENTAWNKYEPSITGLKKVVYGDEELEITINDEDANGDIIGFRVMAVNADGTLVDPDGKAFYVVCGELDERNALNFEMTFPNAVQTIEKLGLTYNVAANVEYGEFSMNIANNVTLTAANIEFYRSNGSVINPLADPAQWANVAKVGLVSVSPLNLVDGTTYKGSIDLYRTVGAGQALKVATIPVTLKKVMPTSFLGTGFDFKSGQGINNKLIAYPRVPSGSEGQTSANGTYNFPNGFNGVTGNILFKQVGNTAGLTFNGQAVTVANAKVGKQTNGNHISYTANAMYTYGNISTVRNPWTVDWKEGGFGIEFHSYMEDCAYAWDAAQQIVFNVNGQTIDLSKINVQPPYGDSFNTLGFTGGYANATSDGIRYTDFTAYMLLGNSKVKNEYFYVDVDKNNNTLLFRPNADNSESAPTTDLNGTVYLVFTDDFGHEVTVSVNGSFIMKKGQ